MSTVEVFSKFRNEKGQLEDGSIRVIFDPLKAISLEELPDRMLTVKFCGEAGKSYLECITRKGGFFVVGSETPSVREVVGPRTIESTNYFVKDMLCCIDFVVRDQSFTLNVMLLHPTDMNEVIENSLLFRLLDALEAYA